MMLSSISDHGVAPALVKTLSYNEKRLSMIAENVANIHTPGYRAKHLDVRAFQSALRDALHVRGGDPGKPLRVNGGREVQTDAQGNLLVKPSERPPRNVLFHDGTNISLEREMADLAETGMMHELASTLLAGHFNFLRKAIRGTL